MRFFALVVILAALPASLVLLRSNQHSRWIFIALGAMPMLYPVLNLDGSFISWPFWQGHARGLVVTIVDPLALAIFFRFANRCPAPQFLWAYLLFTVSLMPGLFTGYFTPASFFYFQVIRIVVLFYAVYLSVSLGKMRQIVEGLAIGCIVSGAFSVYQSLSGQFQAAGILGHQNLTGMATNLSFPVVLALGLTTKRPLFLIAALLVSAGAIAGGSRATILIWGMTMAATLAAVLIVKPNRRSVAIAAVSAAVLAIASPFAVHKLAERDAGFEKDGERLAFEAAAREMITDYPWGVGLNQYVPIANQGGYLDRAGVRWGHGARSTSVHNTYLLVRAEAGLPGFLGMLVLLFSPIIVGARALTRKHLPLREVSISSSIALVGLAVHAQYEWVAITTSPQYLMALAIGVIAALARAPSSQKTPGRLRETTQGVRRYIEKKSAGEVRGHIAGTQLHRPKLH